MTIEINPGETPPVYVLFSNDAGTKLEVVSPDNPLPVNASVSVSASIAGFTPNGSYSTPLSVTTSSAETALPSGTVVLVSNTGAQTAYVNLGTSGSVTSTTSDIVIPAGGNVGLTVGANTNLAAITSTGTTTINIAGGAGLVTGYGGGGSGGSGGNVTVVGPLGSAVSASSVSVVVASDQAAVAVKQPTAANLNATVVGTGTFATQAAQSGTWNVTNVSGTVSLPTGASTAALQPTNAAQGSTTSGQTGPLVQAAVTTSAPTYTNAQTSPLSQTTGGALRVAVVSGGGTGGTSSNFGSAFPTPGTAVGASDGTNMQPLLVDGSGNLKVNVESATGVAQGSTTSGQTISPIGGAVTTSAPTYTTAQTNLLSLDTSGNLRVTGTFAGVAQGSTTSGQTVTTTGVATLSSLPTNTTAQTNMPIADIGGQLITQQFAPTGSMARGTGTSTNTSAQTIMAASGNANLYEYITGLQLGRTDAGTTALTVTLNDSATSVFVVPNAGNGGGSNLTFNPPLRIAKNTAVTMTSGTGVSTLYGSCQGYYGP